MLDIIGSKDVKSTSFGCDVQLDGMTRRALGKALWQEEAAEGKAETSFETPALKESPQGTSGRALEAHGAFLSL